MSLEIKIYVLDNRYSLVNLKTIQPERQSLDEKLQRHDDSLGQTSHHCNIHETHSREDFIVLNMLMYVNGVS